MRSRMVWMVEKKIVHHVLDMGFERLEIPVRVKFEFELKEGIFVTDSLSKETLYNQKAVQKRFPTVKLPLLDREIEKTVENEIMDYLRQCELLGDKSHETT
jgi:hypothetical protein